MKSYQPNRLRNVALVSHSSAGKSSLAESLLHLSGATTRRGRVEDRNTVSDFDPEEQRRGISINLSVLPVEWRDHKINLLDAPGYLDFAGEARSALRVADGAVILVDAVSGAEVGTELMWEYATERSLPKLIFMNKLDRDTARFARALASLRDVLGARVVPIALPIGEGAGWRGVVNLLDRKAYDRAGKEMALPDDMADRVHEAIVEMMEAAAEGDDELIMKYLDGEELTPDEVRRGLREGVEAGTIIPVLAGSATEGGGVGLLADAILELLPAPDAAPAEQADGRDLKVDPDGPLVAYVFKTVVDPYGTLSIFRVYSGTMRGNGHVRNQRTGEDERLGQLFVVRGKEQLPVSELVAGDIGALPKLSQTQTGDSLGAAAIEAATLPTPVFSAAVIPQKESEIDKLGVVLARVALEDPSLQYERRADTHQLVLSGLGDTHLDVAKHRLERLGIHVNLETPQVAYKETISGQARARYRHKKQTGGAGQFGEVELRVEPLPRGSDFEFTSEVFGGAISGSYIPSIEKGVRSVMGTGVIAGFPVVDVKVAVVDGKEHPVDSKDIAFQVAGREAFKQAFREARPVLLEPIYDVTITVPEGYLGDVMGDISSRRGRVQGMEQHGHKAVVQAQVPEASMLRYAVDLRSMTQGHGYFTMTLSHFDPVPEFAARDLIANAKLAHEHD